MGAWGPGPYDNDSALDLTAQLKSKPIYAVIRDGLDSKENHQIIAAASLLSSLCNAFANNPKGLRELAIAHIRAILNNKTWLASWNKADHHKLMLEKLLDSLNYTESSSCSHVPDWSSVHLTQNNDEDLYCGVNCQHCGSLGCIGKVCKVNDDIVW